jgi:hypothetical protein
MVNPTMLLIVKMDKQLNFCKCSTIESRQISNLANIISAAFANVFQQLSTFMRSFGFLRLNFSYASYPATYSWRSA